MRQNKGFVHILVILLVLAVSGGIVFYVTRNEIFTKAASPTPLGNLAVNPTSGSNSGSFTLTAQGVEGANGAQVDNVRYYLLNPKLAAGNNWGKADWCANSSFTQPAAPSFNDLNNNCGTFTFDVSESSNPGNNYQIVWDKNTHSSGSTPYSRALTATNIPPGTYTVGLRIQDVNGNVNGGASQVKITVTDGTPPPTPTPLPDLGLKFSTTYFGLKMAPGGVGKKAFDLTSTGATKFWLYTPTNSLGITFSPSEGNITPGQTIPIYVKAGAGQQYGIYTGKVYASSSQINAQTETGVSDSITIEPETTDSDADGFINSAELVMGTDPNYSCKTPSAINAWPPDVNNDGVVNTVDSQAVFNAFSTKKYVARYDMNGDGVIGANDAQKVHSYNGKTCQSTVPDNDKDGFANDIEVYVGTDLNKACSLPGNVKAWPVDFNNDGGVGMTTDMLQLIQHSGVNSTSPSYDRRYDLNADGIINDSDQTILKYFAGRTCTPGT